MFKKTAANVSSKHKYIFDIDHTLYSDKDFTDSDDSANFLNYLKNYLVRNLYLPTQICHTRRMF